MASRTTICIAFLFAILSVSIASYVEALAGAFDYTNSRVELRVAVREGYYSKYADFITGAWVTDTSATYTSDRNEILKYCQKKYPNSEVTNIVDSSEPVVIDQWCPVTGEECTESSGVTYYRCLVGPFESDALMVYNVCKFYHQHDENTCEDPTYWKGVADKACHDQEMVSNKTGMLLPCGVDVYKGIEYTCCPTPTPTPPGMVEEEPEVLEEGDDDEEEEEEEEEGAEAEVEAPPPVRDNTITEPEITNNIRDDPYFSETGLGASAEKQEYQAAKNRVSGKQKGQMARIMQQWQEAQEHYEMLKTKDAEAAEKMRKEMTRRFEETIGAMEANNAEEDQELREAHQVHVELGLKSKVNASFDAYRVAVSLGKPKAKKILHALRRYLHAVQKERQHYITHYKHLRKSDPLRADDLQHITLQKLRALDKDVAQSVEMLKGLTDVYEELKPKVDALLESTADSPDDAAFIQATEDAANEEPSEEPVAVDNVEPVPELEVDDEEDEEVEEEDEEEVEIDELMEDTEAPTEERMTETKTSTQTKAKTSPVTQTGPAAPATSSRIVQGESSESRTPNKFPIVAVKPLESYLDEEVEVPIEADLDQPKTIIVAQKPDVKVQKSAAAARVEKQRLVNRPDVDSVDTSVTKKRMQFKSEPMMAFGLACGVLAVATVLVIAVLIVRRKTRRTPINQGFTEVDPNLTVEQRHIVSMQQNGYENPTYKYFDMQ